MILHYGAILIISDLIVVLTTGMSLIRRGINRQAYQCVSHWLGMTRHGSKVVKNSHTCIVISTNYRQFHNRASCQCQNKILNKTGSSIDTNQHGVLLNYGDYHLDLPYLWLRDHCRCSTCFNYETFQKNVEANPLFPVPVPVHVEFDNRVLTIKCKYVSYITSV